ncbi:uroporphyrin-III C-methyltransferase / precorrin-2 dehydrogenase / sirohydrochlorin ferrochelatase [Allochromatium warmingii]|uniref:Siroheme synthase n=2 Tax=Allochromatium warmingii TaxID=61595 RepID=A0A1H3EVC1_ALLWA|nr:uroporphyrin-III C-methyltransferase / precorrin-2 dehydrogenase / sirohydrochlorin ferrochelatase [Allochromatium warmingii]
MQLDGAVLSSETLNQMDLLPVFLDMRARPCLVVGGGATAARKVANLLRAGAAVTLVSPELCATLAHQVAAGALRHEARRFVPADIAGQRLVIAATDDRAINRQIAELANAAEIPVNVVDDPDACTFVLPSIVDRSPVTIAVSSGKTSPVLARMLRTRLEALIPAGYGRLAELSGRYRERVKARFSAQRDRRRFWDRILQGAVAERILAGQFEEAEAIIERELAPDALERDLGEVYLVGAGPGDPDLISFRALRLMQQADVVVYDRLVAAPILNMTRRDAQRIYVGKERNHHAMRQEEINRLLADLAKDGHRVLRLKGGDPFIFGRGGEEIDTLAAEGVPFQVIPGITAASGCAAYAGIPLTHRDYAQSVTFVTGHLKDGSIDLNWPALAQPHQTIVFYMGLVGLPIIVQQLLAHGVAPEMPIALVQQGTTHLQRVYTGTLATICASVEADPPAPPTLLIVGEVVQLRDKLNWYRPPDEPVQGATTSIV